MGIFMRAAILTLLLQVLPAFSFSNSTTIGRCSFFGEAHVRCSGRLLCRVNSFMNENGAFAEVPPALNNVCPGMDEEAEGVYDLAQGLIPQEFVPSDMNNRGYLIADCIFRTNGTFHCTAGIRYPNAFWSGVWSGSLNKAFRLGLDETHYQSQEIEEKPTTAPASYDRWNVPAHRDREQEYPYIENTAPVIGIGAVDVAERHNAVRRPLEDRYRPQPDASDDVDSVHYTIPPRRVFICEYYVNGFVKCRNCTERISQMRLDSGEVGDRRDYHCVRPTQGPYIRQWTRNNRIIPADPDPRAPEDQLTATCVFEKVVRTYECHGESTDCQIDSSQPSRNRCLTGRRWTGTYTGNMDML